MKKLLNLNTLIYALFISVGSAVIAEDEPIFELSPFEVNSSQDRGYISSNAVSAYRINLPIQDIPIQIKVVTKEFLNDIKAVNLEEALGYSVGVTRDVQEREAGRFSIRGLQASFPKRNGYRRYYTVDMTNVERVEVIKGPASALFGEAQPGGIINYVTKKPLPEFRNSVTLTYGSYDYKRVLFESTGPLNESKSLLYRLDASYLDRNDYRDFSFEDRIVIAPLLQWSPSKATTLKFDYEYIKRDFLPPSRAPVFNRRALEFFNALPTGPVDLRQIAIDSELRVRDTDLAPFITTWRAFIPDEILPEDITDLYLWRDINTSLPREWSSTGPGSWDFFESSSFTIEGTHEFENDSSLRLASSFAKIDTSNLRGRPNRSRIWGDGYFRGQRFRFSENEVMNVQVDYLLPIDLGWSRHTLIIGSEIFQDNFESVEWGNPTAGTFYLMNYFDDSPIPSRRTDRDGEFVNFGIREYPLEVGPEEQYLGTQPTRQERETQSIYISDQISMLNEKLKILAGLRLDVLEQRLYEFFTASDLIREDETIENWSPQFGVNYEIFDGFSLYGNFSESFSPGLGGFELLNSDGTTTTITRPPEQGEGIEFGAKFTLLDGRLSGSVAYFDIEKIDITLSLRTAGGLLYNTLVNDGSQGYEFDVAYEIFSGFQVLFGYAYIDSVRDDPTTPEWSRAIDSRVPGVPEHQVTLWTKYQFVDGFFEGLSIGGGVQILDDFRGHSAIPDLLLLDGYTKIDFLLSYTVPQLEEALKFSLFVDNLFDEDFYYAGPIPATPRNYKVSISYSF